MSIGNWYRLDFFGEADTGWVKAAGWRGKFSHVDEVLSKKKKNEKVLTT